MRVLSYDPSEDSFFVAVTWDEYRHLAAEYEIDTGGRDAEEVVEDFKVFQEDQKDSDEFFAAKYPYRQYIMDLYGIDDMPDICLVIDRDLSFLKVELYDYPFGHMWNGYSPWKKIETTAINDLNELAALECVEKGQQASNAFACPDCEETEEKPECDASGAHMPGPEKHTIKNLLERAIEHMEKGGMYNLFWSRKELTAQKLGIFCEYYAKMTLLSYGVSVYTSEIDDHGIDFVAESRNGFLKFQVKGVRSLSQYVFMPKEYFNIEDDSMFLFLILLVDGEHPDMYIIPTSAWRQESRVFVSHDYKGKKSKPDYGVNISKKNMPELEKYKIKNMLSLF